MADIHKHGNGETVPIKDVAERQNLSQRYLSQLATLLKNAQLLKSVWGMHGGYKLARPGREITILEVVEAIEGPISIIDCIIDDHQCDRTEFCNCHELWMDVNDGIREKLGSRTIDDLANGTINKTG